MDWKNIVSGVAPIIAGTLTGGNPVVIALTSSIVKKALGLPTEATDAEITSSIQSDPDALVKIRQAELELQAKLKEYGIEDIANARQMQIQTRDKTPFYLTILTMIMFFVMLWFVCYMDVPTAMHDTFMLMLGLVISCVKDVYGFFFGSSASSSSKNDVIANMVQR